MDKTALGDRMKNYEATSKTKLLCRTPVIIRVDGKAFHTWTRRLVTTGGDPFNYPMHEMMVMTSMFLMDNIQNAVLAYTQSDEISILMNDWKKLNTDQWFGNNVQKMASVSASAATAAFNYRAGKQGYINNISDSALFDSRVYNMPKEEVVNYFLWRQQDASRNSVSMLGRHYFSQKQMNGKSVSEVQDMLMKFEDVNWNDLDVWKKRGTCVDVDGADEHIPIFSQDRQYIEKLLKAEEE